MDEKPRILLVEDDQFLADLIQDYLEGKGYEVGIETRGDQAAHRICNEKPDLLILDLMLPGQDGLKICQAVRPAYNGLILILTASEDDMDQVAGLEIGADDYVKKPVEPRVLLARIRALLRRFGKRDSTVYADVGEAPEEDLQLGCLLICRASHTVFLDGCEVGLTTTEYDLLCLLVRNAGIVLDRNRIFLEVRGIEYDGLDRSIDISILRLRKKLEKDPSEPRRIKTIWRHGYLLVKDAWLGEV